MSIGANQCGGSYKNCTKPHTSIIRAIVKVDK